MKVVLRCTNCNKRISYEQAKKSNRRCPACGGLLALPILETLNDTRVAHTCPNLECNRRLRFPRNSAGKTARCPACKTKFRVPEVIVEEQDQKPAQAAEPAESQPPHKPADTARRKAPTDAKTTAKSSYDIREEKRSLLEKAGIEEDIEIFAQGIERHLERHTPTIYWQHWLVGTVLLIAAIVAGFLMLPLPLASDPLAHFLKQSARGWLNYIGLAGAAALAISGVTWVLRNRLMWPVTIAAAVIMLAAVVVPPISVRSRLSSARSELASSSDKTLAHAKLGIALAQKLRTQEAIEHLNKALSQRGKLPRKYAGRCHYFLAVLLAMQNLPPQGLDSIPPQQWLRRHKQALAQISAHTRRAGELGYRGNRSANKVLAKLDGIYQQLRRE